MHTHPLFVGIDLGTSAVRTCAIDDSENVRAMASVDLPSAEVTGQRIEQNPFAWWTAVCDCLEFLCQQIDPQQIAAIAVDGTSGTLLLADKQYDPLVPALMYNDSRSGKQARDIAKAAPENTAAQGPSCTLAKLLWLYEDGLKEDAYNTFGQSEEAPQLMHQSDWISAQLCNHTNTACVTDSNNALKLGYDAQNQCWPQWLLDLLARRNIPQSLLPHVVAPGTPIGMLNPEVAQRFSLQETTQIIAGTTDSTASFIATGANQAGDAVSVLGSTLVVKVISDTPVFSHQHGVYSQPLTLDDRQYWLVGGGSNTGGHVLRHYFTPEELTHMTSRLNPQSPSGLDYYPLISVGERFPRNDPAFRGRLEPRPDDDVLFFQGMLEGIARVEADAYALLETLGAPYPRTLRTTGGGAVNEPWTMIRKQSLRPTVQWLPATNTEAAFGSACIAKRSMHT